MRPRKREASVFMVLVGFLSVYFLTVVPLLAETMDICTANQGRQIAGILYAHKGVGRAGHSQRTVVFSLKSTRVVLDVVAGSVRVWVTQVFVNDANSSATAIYLYPLPEGAVVTNHAVRMGGRAIYTAWSTHHARVQKGDTGTCTTVIRHYLPRQRVEISLTYTQALEYRQGMVSVCFPMVATHFSQTDRNRPNPLWLPSNLDPRHRFELTVDISGIPLCRIRSNTHDVLIEAVDPRHLKYRVFLASDMLLPNADFIMDIILAENNPTTRPLLSSQPGISGHRERGR